MATKKKSASRKELISGTPVPIEIPRPSNGAEVPSTYVNNFEILSMNHIDVRIAFNEIVIEGADRLSSMRRANLVMPVPIFMALTALLSANARNLAIVGPQQAHQEQSDIQALIDSGTRNAADAATLGN